MAALVVGWRSGIGGRNIGVLWEASGVVQLQRDTLVSGSLCIDLLTRRCAGISSVADINSDYQGMLKEVTYVGGPYCAGYPPCALGSWC